MRPTAPPNHLRTHEDICARIRQYIDQEQLAPGHALPAERVLAKIFHISRHTLREAIRTMEERGELISKRGSGTYIAPDAAMNVQAAFRKPANPHYRRMHEIFQLREILEPQIARLAARHARNTDLDELNALLLRQEDCHDEHILKELDSAFHRTVAKSTGNDLLLKIMDELNAALEDARASQAISGLRQSYSLDGHKALLTALAAGDEKRAEETMIEHIATVKLYAMQSAQ